MQAWKQLLVFSDNSDFLNFLQEQVHGLDYSIRLIRSADEVQVLEAGYMPDVLILDLGKESDANTEKIVDTIKTRNPQLKTAFVYRPDFNFDFLTHSHDGLNSILLQNPLETDLLLDWLFSAAPIHLPMEKMQWKFLSAVFIPDLAPEEELGFDLFYYMPANKKFLLYSRKNGRLSREQIEKFAKHKITNFFVPKNQLADLQKYLAGRLSRVQKDGKLTTTARRDRLRIAAKEVFQSLLSGPAKDSKLALESCKNVALTFIQDTSDQPELYKKLLELMAQSKSNYSHSVNVSIYATLFAMVLGYQKMEPISVAGLLHDIGLSLSLRSLDEANYENLGESDKVRLRAHPDASARLVRERSAIEDEEIIQAILQHHERNDGSGYPNGLRDNQISTIAKIVAIADEFDHLTSAGLGHTPKTPADAIATLEAAGHLDPKLLRELGSTFHPPKEFNVTDEHIRALMRDPIKVESEESA